MAKKRIGDLSEDLTNNELLYPLQDTYAPAGGHSAGKMTSLEADQTARRRSLIRIQEHFALIFPAAGSLPIYVPRFALNFFHLTKMEFTVTMAVAAINLVFGSGSNVATIAGISTLHTALAANAYIQKDMVINPLSALQAGDTLWCTVNGACTVTGEIIGWESPEQYPVDFPVR